MGSPVVGSRMALPVLRNEPAVIAGPEDAIHTHLYIEVGVSLGGCIRLYRVHHTAVGSLASLYFRPVISSGNVIRVARRDIFEFLREDRALTMDQEC